MSKTYYVRGPEGSYTISGYFGQVPSDAVCRAPMEDGQIVRDVDWLDIIEVEDEGSITKQAIVNPTKKAAKLALAQAARDERAALAAQKEVLYNNLKGKKSGDLKNEEDIKKAIEDILDYLGLG
jgi:hypothetical protein